MTTAIQLADAIGRKKIADAVGVLPTAVSNHVVRGVFPSSWFLAIQPLAIAAGQECPPALFKMRLPSPQAVDVNQPSQAPLPKRAGA